MIKWLTKSSLIKIGIATLITITTVMGISSMGNHLKIDEDNHVNLIDNMHVIKSEVEIEYGSPLSLQPQDYLEIKNEVVHTISAEVYKDVEDSNLVEKVKDVSLMEVGDYLIVFSCGNEKKEVKVRVVDTQYPIITLNETDVVLNCGDLWSVDKYLQSCIDLVDGPLDYVVTGSVNTKKSGLYTVTITACDKNGLTAESKIKVQVKEGKKNDSNKEEKKKVDKETPKDDPDYDPFAGSSGNNKDKVKEDVLLVPWSVDEVPIERRGDGDLAFATKQEAIEWAKSQTSDVSSPWYGYKYMLSQIQKYGQKRLENDPWAVMFISVN